MHHLLGIPEILLLVFSCLPRSSNASNARVCKTWSQPALDTVWRDCQIDEILKSLAPITMDEESHKLVCPSFIHWYALYLIYLVPEPTFLEFCATSDFE